MLMAHHSFYFYFFIIAQFSLIFPLLLRPSLYDWKFDKKSNMQAQLLIKSEKGNNNELIMLLIISIRSHARVISR